MELGGVESLELFLLFCLRPGYGCGIFFFFVSCLLYQSRSRDLFIGWEYCVLSHKETQTGDCQLVLEELSDEPSATGNS